MLEDELRTEHAGKTDKKFCPACTLEYAIQLKQESSLSMTVLCESGHTVEIKFRASDAVWRVLE